MKEDATQPQPAGFTIRRARPADLPAVRALMLRTFEQDFGYGYRPEFHSDVDDLQGVYLNSPRQVLYVATDDATGELIGTGGVRAEGLKPAFCPAWLVARYDPLGTAQLVRVYTARKHRRRGAARALVERLLRFVADEPSYRTLALHTDPRSPGAERFWRSLPTHEIYDDRDGPSGSIFFEMEIPRRAADSHSGSNAGAEER